MFFAFERGLRHIVRHGSLIVITSDGEQHSFGNNQGKTVAFRLTDRASELKLAAYPEFQFGECYMNGTLVMEQGSIYDLLSLLLSNLEQRNYPSILKWQHAARRLLKWLQQYNSTRRAKRNVAHHYDLSGALYDLFLDRDRQYSCAYFESVDQSLEDAQLAKKRHLAAKLMIKPGMTVLDIGSGWGGLGLYLAEVCGADVTGVTLSNEQYKLANERARQRGVGNRVKFELLDYRRLNGRFDRIVSVGMFEHVGVNHYREFFDKVASLLTDDGVGVLHSINRSRGPGATSAWVAKYIFPGGYIPAMSEVVPAMEKALLYITDIEILRLHYAETLKEWGRRFSDHRERAKEIYDERFCRMWEFYLASSEAAFRYGGFNNFQIQFARHQHALPMLRNYMMEEEERLRAIDSQLPRLKSIPAK
ncbi:MAG TPA: cyclopropane-fatty-acyl-phospholipid synthase family protein [Aestuariivirgaceae bacterium]|jgi:cyclopropane-fatty-acyl-phospholipid synthase